MTAQKTWTAGDVLTAADMNTYARGGQEMGYAQITADQTGITTVADVTGLSVTWTAISSRVYLLTANVSVTSSVADDRLGVYISDSGGTQKAARFSNGIRIATRELGMIVQYRVTGLTGSVTYKVRAERTAGTGTMTVFGSASSASFFHVQDVGAA